MIRVTKSTDVPDQLSVKGIPATAEVCRLYDANPTGYNHGTIKFEIDSDIYGHTSVKKQLIAEQHGKCCFCEADFTANGYGDVEHFRPKAGYTTTPSGKLNRPGYYWLSYDWSNLLFSCQICNQRYKKNYFPLADEVHRAKNHTYECRLESPQLIHPSQDNPEEHITYNRHVPIAKDKRGEVSIAGYGLDRKELNRIREEHLQNVQLNLLLAKFDPDTIGEDFKAELVQQIKTPWPELEKAIQTAKTFVAIAAKETQPFAAMVRANFSTLV